MTGRRSGSAGLSLVEVLLSISLLAIVLYAVVSVFPMSVLSLKRAHDSVAAGQIAQRLLEQMRAESFDTLTPRSTSTEQVGNTVFTVEREASLETDANVKHLMVAVTWNTGLSDSSKTITSTKTYETSVFNFTNP